jgi:hypothetical protein
MRLLAALVPTSALLIGATGPVDPRNYETEWKVTSKVDEEFLKPRTIAKDTIVFQQRITFERLAEADSALVEAANGEEFIPSGEQYYRAVTEGPELWCTANMKMPQDAFKQVVIGRVYSQYCILDANKDGTFDSFFKRARTIESLPTVHGKITPTPRPIKPLHLKPVDPNSLRTDYFIGVVFFKNVGHSPDKTPRFQRFAGSEYGRFLIDKPFNGSAGAKQAIDVDEANIVYSVTGEGLQIETVKPFSERLVRIIGTQCGMINGC